MTAYIYTPNFVQIPVTVAEIPSCIDIYNSGFADLSERKFWIIRNGCLATHILH